MKKTLWAIGFIFSIVLSGQIFASQIITAKGAVIAMKCEKNTENKRLVNLAMKNAIENAEAQCNWENGRPSVIPIEQWKIKTRCEDSPYSNYAVGDAFVSSKFSCVNRQRNIDTDSSDPQNCIIVEGFKRYVFNACPRNYVVTGVNIVGTDDNPMVSLECTQLELRCY